MISGTGGGGMGGGVGFSFLSAIGFMGMCSEEESTTEVATRSLLFAEAFSMLRGDDDRMIMFSVIWTICLSSMQSGCKSDIVVVVSVGIAVGVFLLAGFTACEHSRILQLSSAPGVSVIRVSTINGVCQRHVSTGVNHSLTVRPLAIIVGFIVKVQNVADAS
uniref:Uncharacterized protein n=1 Tax=Glossina palpalis gambiensis TaxID=67801 RepID=A0A1B0BUJ2_9MUSC